MAILFDATGEYLSRTSGAVIDHNAAYGLVGYMQRTVNDATHHLVVYIDAGTNYNNCDYMILDWFTGRIGIYVDNAGSSSGIVYGTTSPVINTYYQVGMVRENVTTLKLYVNGSVEATIATDVTGRISATRMSIADLPSGGQPPTGLVTAAWNGWSRAPGAAEITAQIPYAAPQVTTSLFGEWLMLAAAQGADSGGTSHPWSINGTPSNVTDPSITYPSAGGSDRIAPAYVINPPFSFFAEL